MGQELPVAIYLTDTAKAVKTLLTREHVLNCVPLASLGFPPGLATSCGDMFSHSLAGNLSKVENFIKLQGSCLTQRKTSVHTKCMVGTVRSVVQHMLNLCSTSARQTHPCDTDLIMVRSQRQLTRSLAGSMAPCRLPDAILSSASTRCLLLALPVPQLCVPFTFFM